MKKFWFATWIVCLLSEWVVPAAMAAISASLQGDQVFISGDHFRLMIDGRQGGQISDIRLFDSSRWNRLLGADGQTCPAVKICETSAEFSLNKATNTRIENLEVSPEAVRLETSAVPCTADGRASPWTVKLRYEVYAEGAVFVTMRFSLPQGETVLSGAEISLAADRSVVRAAKYRQQIDSPNVNSPTGLPTARLAFGVNPARSFTNEIQAIVEYKASMAGKPQFAADQGRFVWRLADGQTTIRGPFEYRNRFSLGLGAAATGKPRTNVIAQRVYHWINWDAKKDIAGAAWYPTDEMIDKMAAEHATMLVMHMHWMDQSGSNGNPHANYRPRDEEALVRVIGHAHEKGLRVGLYCRGIERYAPSTGFFEKYLRRDWDGLYVDWHGVHCIAYHESQHKPDADMGDTHFSTDGACLPAREYFLYTKKLRTIVGPKGFLIGHMGIGNSGILANLAMDAYLPGEATSDYDMFADIDTAIYKGMMGGVTCMPWVVDAAKTFTSRQGVARMAVWCFYPHAGLAFQRPGKVLYPADPNDPANAYVLPYWRVLAAVDPQRCTVYNSPAVNLVAAESSNSSVSCLVYKEAGERSADDAYLVVAANLSDKPASATITLNPKVLGMSGRYTASRIASQTGAVSPAGIASKIVKTSELAPWQIEGLKLTKATNVPGKLFDKDVFEDWGRWDNKTAQTPYYPAEPVFVYRAHMTRVERVPAADVPPGCPPLPDALIVPPGRYEFHGRAYDLQKEALYRFVAFGKQQQQRIVYRNDLDSLLSAIAWIVSHGNSDSDKSPAALCEKAKSAKLFLTCGPISGWAHGILADRGIRSRCVSTLTLEAWNGYDDGHSMLEVYRQDRGKWVLYDLDGNCFFTRRGAPLSLVEFAYAVMADQEYEIVPLAHDATFDVSNFRADNGAWDCAFLVERYTADMRSWYRRAVQVPMIEGRFFDRANRQRIESYSKSYKYLDKREFQQTFYGMGSACAEATATIYARP